ncbi:MAG: DUF4340 domain-containing protein [Proteobacteria bacterium]|nr:DUF4340 domain-containing protein [Pseudomonadota bacterium]
MKKLIVIAVVILAVGVLIVVFGGVLKRPHTVSDFSVYPCAYRGADRIVIAQQGHETEFSRASGDWRLTRPVDEAVDMDAGVALNNFMFSKLFVDRHEVVTDESWKSYAGDVVTAVKFFKGEQELCAFELGVGEKKGDVDSERRWIRSGNDAYRAYVHLLDFGRVLEQPTAGWRDRRWLQLSTSSIERLEVGSAGERFVADRSGERSAENPQGWRIVSAWRDGEIDVSGFRIDERRIATVVDLVTPLMIDDWVDDLSDQDGVTYSGKLGVTSNGTSYVIEIGDEVDLSRHPEFSRLGEGARYIRVEGDKRVGVASRQRVMGLFPGIDEMRSKRVWSIDTSRLAGVDVRKGEACVRYLPAGPEQWAVHACPGETEAGVRPISARALGLFAKALMRLEAVRYVNGEELSRVLPELSEGGARVLLYMDDLSAVDHEVVLSRSYEKMYRYARVSERGADGVEASGPVFVIAESLASILLEDLGAAK